MGYGGTVINLMGSIADLDGLADGATYRKVIGVDANGQISQASIGPEVSFSASLGEGTVQSNHIASGAVMGYHIADGQVQANHIGGSAVTSGHINDGAIQTNHVGGSAIIGGHIAESSITSNHIAAGAIQGWHIPDATIQPSHLSNAWSGSFFVDGVTYTVVNGLITSTSV